MFNRQHPIDFHCHTSCSDGQLDPFELLQEAERVGLTHLAITDHDTVEGLARILAARPLNLPGKQSGVQSCSGQAASPGSGNDIQACEPVVGPTTVRLITGAEYSCQWRGVNIHILAYGFAMDDPALVALNKEQKERRSLRSARITQLLEKNLGLQNLQNRVAEISAGSVSPGRPHFAKALVGAGVVSDEREAFDRYLGAGKLGDVKVCWPTMEELMADLTTCKAVSVVAHPVHYKLTATRLKSLLEEFKGEGGRAVEIAVPGINAGQYGWLADQSRRLGLVQSFGSDFHGFGGHRKLGCYPAPVQGLDSISQLLF